MEIIREATEGIVQLKIRGSLSGTQSSTVQLFETISIEVEKNAKEITLDMKEVIFLDSMSIGLLVGSLLKCQENNIGFRISNIPDHIKKILDTTNLKKIFSDLY